MRTRLGVLLGLALAAGAAGCGPGTQPSAVGGGDPAKGHDLIVHIGCGACHVIAGVQGADGQVGPNLENWQQRHTVGGVLPNTAANVERWLRDPPAFSPRTTMPDLGVTAQQARDIAAYLYSQ